MIKIKQNILMRFGLDEGCEFAKFCSTILQVGKRLCKTQLHFRRYLGKYIFAHYNKTNKVERAIFQVNLS